MLSRNLTCFSGDGINVYAKIIFVFVWMKKKRKTKEGTKCEETEKGDYGPPTRKVFNF